MKRILPRIWEWSWFSEEKGLTFNGHLLAIGEHRILVDPPIMDAATLHEIQTGGPIDYIVITNRDHEREADTYRQAFQCRIMVPEDDAADMTLQPDKTYKDGELLPGGVWVVQLADQKSRGESALFLEHGQGTMIVGDALLGIPDGSLSLLPPEKYADLSKARLGLQRLLKFPFDSLLVGDGTSILDNAKPVLRTLLQ